MLLTWFVDDVNFAMYLSSMQANRMIFSGVAKIFNGGGGGSKRGSEATERGKGVAEVCPLPQ